MSENLIWVKSTYSGSEGGSCVELAAVPDGGIAVRDSKNPTGPVLRFTTEEWASFMDRIRADS